MNQAWSNTLPSPKTKSDSWFVDPVDRPNIGVMMDHREKGNLIGRRDRFCSVQGLEHLYQLRFPPHKLNNHEFLSCIIHGAGGGRTQAAVNTINFRFVRKTSCAAGDNQPAEIHRVSASFPVPFVSRSKYVGPQLNARHEASRRHRRGFYTREFRGDTFFFRPTLWN